MTTPYLTRGGPCIIPSIILCLTTLLLSSGIVYRSVGSSEASLIFQYLFTVFFKYIEATIQ